MEILPKEGNFMTLKTIRSLREKLGLSEQEIKDWEVENKDNQITWDQDKSEPADLEFSEYETKLIKDELLELDKIQKLTNSHFTIYEKFVEGKKNAKD